MANWKFWQKKQSTQDPDVPQEVREYYESTQANPRARALLVAIITLIVTLLVAFGLFLAGRWVYNQFTDDEQPQVVEVADEDQGSVTINGDSGSNGESSSDSEARQNETQNDQEATTPETLPGDGNNTERNTEDNQRNGANGGGTTDRDRSTRRTPATGSTVPDTGPGNIIAIFAATTASAAGAHAVITSKRR